MGGKERVCFISGRGRRCVRTVSVFLGVLGMVGAGIWPWGQVRAESGYLKPDVDSKALRKAEGYFEEGVELYRNKSYRAALRKFQGAERACPELFSGGYHVALAYRKMGDEEAAVEQLKKLNSRFPENIIAHNDLGVIYGSRKEKDGEVLAHLEFEMAVRNGENLLRGKEKNIAQVKVDVAMAWANLGALQLKNNKLTDALESFGKSAEHYPRAFFGHYGMGNVLFTMGRLEEAKVAYRKAEQIEPNNVSVHIALARCYLLALEKKPRFAIGELKKVKPREATPEVYELFGDAYALLGRQEDAIENYNRHIQFEGHNRRVLYKLGAVYYNDGQFERAENYLREFVSAGWEGNEEVVSTAYKLLGDIGAARKDWNKAIADYGQGSRLRDNYLSCYYGLAECYYEIDEKEKAREYVELVLKGLGKNETGEENELRRKAGALLKKIGPEKRE